MKLSKAQAKAIADAKFLIDEARSCETLEEYVLKHDHYYATRGIEYIREHANEIEWKREYWENYKSGNVLSRAGKNTIEALVKMGVFTVIEYENSRKSGVLDWIHLNNY